MAMTANSGFGIIRPTPLERAAGRLMRAPDHGADGGGDGAQGGGDGADAGKGGAADGGSNAGQSDGSAAEAGSGDEASLLGGAGTETGSGDGGQDGQQGKKDGGDGEGQADGAPEAYDLKLTVIEKNDKGEDVETPIEMDQALVEAATPVLKKLNLTNDQANELVGLVPQIQERVLQAQADDHSALKAQWAKEVQADKELGGKNWSATEALAAKALDHFGAPSEKDKDGNETNPFRVLLNETGLGNHPEMVRMFRKIGEAVGEDSTVRGDGAAAQKVDRLEVLYPDDVPKDQKQGA
jgi:hypothetical protein